MADLWSDLWRPERVNKWPKSMTDMWWRWWWWWWYGGKWATVVEWNCVITWRYCLCCHSKGRPLFASDCEQKLNTIIEGTDLWGAVWTVGRCSADIAVNMETRNVMRVLCATHGKRPKMHIDFQSENLNWSLNPWSWRWNFRNVDGRLPIEPGRLPRRSGWSVFVSSFFLFLFFLSFFFSFLFFLQHLNLCLSLKQLLVVKNNVRSEVSMKCWCWCDYTDNYKIRWRSWL